jgi:hypothetical protein
MHEEEHNIHLEYSKRSSIEELDTVVSSDMTPKDAQREWHSFFLRIWENRGLYGLWE